MIKASELRTGNWVISAETSKHYQVDGFDISCVEHRRAIFVPIPLIPAILEKAGFENEEHYMTFEVGEVIFHYHKRGKRFGLYTNNEGIADGLICTKEYLHQLQNLYFALTGQEISIAAL